MDNLNDLSGMPGTDKDRPGVFRHNSERLATMGSFLPRESQSDSSLEGLGAESHQLYFTPSYGPIGSGVPINVTANNSASHSPSDATTAHSEVNLEQLQLQLDEVKREVARKESELHKAAVQQQAGETFVGHTAGQGPTSKLPRMLRAPFHTMPTRAPVNTLAMASPSPTSRGFGAVKHLWDTSSSALKMHGGNTKASDNGFASVDQPSGLRTHSMNTMASSIHNPGEPQKLFRVNSQPADDYNKLGSAKLLANSKSLYPLVSPREFPGFDDTTNNHRHMTLKSKYLRVDEPKDFNSSLPKHGDESASSADKVLSATSSSAQSYLNSLSTGKSHQTTPSTAPSTGNLSFTGQPYNVAASASQQVQPMQTNLEAYTFTQVPTKSYHLASLATGQGYSSMPASAYAYSGGTTLGGQSSNSAPLPSPGYNSDMFSSQRYHSSSWMDQGFDPASVSAYGSHATRLSPHAPEFSVNGNANWINQADAMKISQLSSASSGAHASNGRAAYNAASIRPTLNAQVDWYYIVLKIVNACDQQSSIMMQQRIKTAPAEEKKVMCAAIVTNCLLLATNRFGNFLVQRALEYGTDDQVDDIASCLVGNVVNLAKDTFGCHVIQKAFDTVPEVFKSQYVTEMLSDIPNTVIHRYACHVWQKLFELRWENEPPQIMNILNHELEGHWTEVALGETGSLVVQNIFENCLEDDKRPCLDEVLQNIDTISRGQFGNWCIQHIAENADEADRNQAIGHILNNAAEYSMDQYASKVVEKCLKTGTSEFMTPFLDQICIPPAGRTRSPLIDIASDQYGNYLIQWILQNASAENRERICQQVRKHMVSLRGSKYGSRVAMMCNNPNIATRPGASTSSSQTRYGSNYDKFDSSRSRTGYRGL